MLAFACFSTFVAHAWANDTRGAWVALILAIPGPILGWRAWRGSVGAGMAIIAILLSVLWMPPWVIIGFPGMFIGSAVAILGAVGLFRLHHFRYDIER
jgi:hypothetical protein